MTRSTADSRLLVAILLLTALVSGCGDTHADDDTHQSAAQKHFACHETDRDRCYPPDILPAYCEVQAAREFFEEGKLKAAGLPAWADKTVRNGSPLIVDFRHPDGASTASKMDLLDAFLRQHHLQVDEDEIRVCVGRTTNGDIMKTQGGSYAPQGTA